MTNILYGSTCTASETVESKDNHLNLSDIECSAVFMNVGPECSLEIPYAKTIFKAMLYFRE